MWPCSSRSSPGEEEEDRLRVPLEREVRSRFLEREEGSGCLFLELHNTM
jgi:hypothetical protein